MLVLDLAHVVRAGNLARYHCEVGVSHELPWTPEEEMRVREAALVETLRYQGHGPLTQETIAERQVVLRKLADVVVEERELVSV